jgi:uncharacterized membrane protein YgaE (UPF0421/DUF939 family)
MSSAPRSAWSIPSLTEPNSIARWKRLPDFQLSIRAAAAAGIAAAVALWLNLQFPIYAMISAVVVTDLSSTETRKLGPARMAGTILGAVIGAMTNLLLPHGSWTIALGVFAAMFASRLLNVGDGKLAGYVSGIVLLDHSQQPWSYAVLRVLETALGILAAVLISYIPKMIRPQHPESDSSHPK